MARQRTTRSWGALRAHVNPQTQGAVKHAVFLKTSASDAGLQEWGGGGVRRDGAGQGWIRTAVHRRRGGDLPPPSRTPPLLPFQCLRLTAKILLRRLRCQEDLRFKIVGPPSAGTIGGPLEEGGSPANPPSTPPPPPSTTSLGQGTGAGVPCVGTVLSLPVQVPFGGGGGQSTVVARPTPP